MTEDVKAVDKLPPVEFSAASLSPIIHAIVSPVTMGVGTMNDVMTLLEKVVTGVLLVASRSPDGDERMLEILAGNVRGHLTRARIAGFKRSV